MLSANTGVQGKLLIIDDQFEDKELLAARNIERVTVSEAAHINAWTSFATTT